MVNALAINRHLFSLQNYRRSNLLDYFYATQGSANHLCYASFSLACSPFHSYQLSKAERLGLGSDRNVEVVLVVRVVGRGVHRDRADAFFRPSLPGRRRFVDRLPGL